MPYPASSLTNEFWKLSPRTSSTFVDLALRAREPRNLLMLICSWWWCWSGTGTSTSTTPRLGGVTVTSAYMILHRAKPLPFIGLPQNVPWAQTVRSPSSRYLKFTYNQPGPVQTQFVKPANWWCFARNAFTGLYFVVPFVMAVYRTNTSVRYHHIYYRPRK